MKLCEHFYPQEMCLIDNDSNFLFFGGRDFSNCIFETFQDPGTASRFNDDLKVPAKLSVELDERATSGCDTQQLTD